MRGNSKNISDNFLYDSASAQYDALAKRILSWKPVLANILQRVVVEFKDVTVADIVNSCIEGEPVISQVLLNRDQINRPRQAGVTTGKIDVVDDADKEALLDKPVIHGWQNEDITQTEGKVVFDILFHAKVPKSGELITLIINVEAQRNYRMPYPLVKRAIYYISRLISSQKMTEFTGSDYGKLKKVYSIWICMDGPTNRDTINRYELKEIQELGAYKEKIDNYDLMGIAMICLGRQKSRDRLMELLRLLFKEQESTRDKRKQLKSKYNITLSDIMEEEVSHMCNLSLGIKEEAIQEGILLGRVEGKEKAKVEAVIGLLKKQVSIDIIAEALQVSVDYVKQIGKANKLL